MNTQARKEETRIAPLAPARIAPDLSAPRVLVLNASYEPLQVTSIKRAITLLQYGSPKA